VMSKHGELLLHIQKRASATGELMKLLEALNRIPATMCDTNCKMSNASQVVSLVHMLHTGTIQTQMFSHWM
jgi:hypothetical protein